eukprot:gnl/Chilomastix_caulleri/2448.p1 GENE.gnl/Chilomastix_caulleri/2448~~gnl/Chilomastix_caulleri/2448.p1  ORF type:complete len:157 (+),score=26.77 gnl/Chilomastix_caulleri/2448:46-516(+)
MEGEPAKILNIRLIGDAGSGKTQLINMYANGVFYDGWVGTMGLDFVTKIIDGGGEKIRAQIWDTSLQDRHGIVPTVFFIMADVILLVFDLAKRASFEHLNYWIDRLKEVGSGKHIIIVGNKADLPQSVTDDEAYSYASSKNMDFIKNISKDRFKCC